MDADNKQQGRLSAHDAAATSLQRYRHACTEPYVGKQRPSSIKWDVYITRTALFHHKHVTAKKRKTRSSAIAEVPRDASCQLKSCQLPRSSAETTYTTSPDQIDGMKLEI